MGRTRTKKNASKKRSGILLWIRIFTLLLVLAFIFLLTKQQREDVPSPNARQQNPDREWPLPSPPGGTKPKGIRPPMPSTLPPADPSDWVALSQRVEVLVKQHPHPDIRNDLNRLIENGTILLNWQTKSFMDGMFQVVPARVAKIVTNEYEKAGKDEYLALTFGPEWLAGLHTPDDIVLAMLIVYHEYQHYLQWVSGDEAIRASLRSQHDPTLAARYTPRQACTMMWQIENGAYQAECRLALQIDYPLFGEFCEYVDTTEWPHALFTALGKNNVYYRDRRAHV